MAITSMWKRDYRLDKMTLKELWVAYLLYPAIQAYIGLSLVSSYFVWRWAEAITPLVIASVAVIALYPFAWYLLHRFVLHGRYLYKSRFTAKIWKRIHFDHHRDPHDLKVLFGALYTTLPTIFIITAPVGYAIGGGAGLMAAFATGLIFTCIYEFCHCIQHLRYAPEWEFLKRIKRLHLQHHFHDENTNYGIISFLPDQLLHTMQDSPKEREKSPTVFNLGYTGEEVRLYPWVVRQTDDLDEQHSIEHGVDRRYPAAS